MKKYHFNIDIEVSEDDLEQWITLNQESIFNKDHKITEKDFKEGLAEEITDSIMHYCSHYFVDSCLVSYD